MKVKKVLGVALCAAMVGSMAVPAVTVQAADDTLVYWSMWEATEPQGKIIQEAVDAYTAETGVKVDLQFKGRTGNREALQPALDGGTQIDIFDEDIDRVNGMYAKYLLDLEDMVKESGYEETAIPGLMAACRDAGGGTLKQSHISRTYLHFSTTKICSSRRESKKSLLHGQSSWMYARN